jgi:hypothetical protein
VNRIRPDTLLLLGGLAALGFVLVKVFDFGKGAVDSAAGGIANLWLELFPLPPAIELLGTVRFPGNLKVPLKNLNVRTNASHDVFVQYAGYTWQLAPQVNGEWPATRVS